MGRICLPIICCTANWRGSYHWGWRASNNIKPYIQNRFWQCHAQSSVHLTKSCWTMLLYQSCYYMINQGCILLHHFAGQMLLYQSCYYMINQGCLLLHHFAGFHPWRCSHCWSCRCPPCRLLPLQKEQKVHNHCLHVLLCCWYVQLILCSGVKDYNDILLNWVRPPPPLSWK